MDGGLSVSEKNGFQIFLNSNLAFTVDPTFQNLYFRHHREPMLHFRTQPLISAPDPTPVETHPIQEENHTIVITDQCYISDFP